MEGSRKRKARFSVLSIVALTAIFLAMLIGLSGVASAKTVLNLTNYCSITQIYSWNGTVNETDPVFNASAAVNVTSTHVSFLNNIHYDIDSLLKIVWMHWVIP